MQSIWVSLITYLIYRREPVKDKIDLIMDAYFWSVQTSNMRLSLKPIWKQRIEKYK